MKVWWAAVKLGALTRFAYRLEVVVALVSAALAVTLAASVWGAVMGGTSRLGGLDATQISTYVIIAWLIAGAANTRLDRELGDRYRDGRVAADLLRPLDLPLWLLLTDLGRAASVLLVTALPVAIAASVVFPFAWPASPVSWIACAISVVLAVGIGGQVALLAGVAAFPLRNADGAVAIKATLVALLSGAIVPLDAIPEPARQVVLWLPFQAMAHTPAMIFLEQRSPAEVLSALGIQLAWFAVLAIAARLAWRRALFSLAIHGG